MKRFDDVRVFIRLRIDYLNLSIRFTRKNQIMSVIRTRNLYGNYQDTSSSQQEIESWNTFTSYWKDSYRLVYEGSPVPYGNQDGYENIDF